MRHALFTAHPALPRVLPFAVYMAFVAVTELAGMATDILPALAPLLTPESQSLLYPVKIGCTALALAASWSYCIELRRGDLAIWRSTLLSLGAGVAVFALWIAFTQPWATLPGNTGFTPDAGGTGWSRGVLIAFRLTGAALVVPIIEELFWRSFLIRFLQHANFLSVPMGAISRLSFFATAVLFGLEHHMVLAGILAGILYNVIYWRTASLAQCVLAHAVTNAILGGYVLATGNWWLW